MPTTQAHTQQDWVAMEIRVTPRRSRVYRVTGGGGNLAVFAGPDGVLMVDADYAEFSERIPGAVDSVVAESDGSDPSLRYLVNTHRDFDHRSGNENLARAGATLIAHERVGRLLAEDQVMNALGGREVPAAPTLFFNGMYPFIDIDNGGNLPGMVAALEEVLAHSRETTLFIPGHGPLAGQGGFSEPDSWVGLVYDGLVGGTSD